MSVRVCVSELCRCLYECVSLSCLQMSVYECVSELSGCLYKVCVCIHVFTQGALGLSVHVRVFVCVYQRKNNYQVEVEVDSKHYIFFFL